MMFANSLALIAQEFPPNERGTALGIWGATTGFAVAVGPLVGGVLTDALRLGVDLPRERPDRLVTLALTLMRVRESERDPTARIDWAGPRDLQRRPLLSCLRADPRKRRRLGQHQDRRAARGGRAPAGRASQRSSSAATSRCSTCASSAFPPSPARRSWRSRSTPRCSRCSSTSRSTSRTSSATRRWRAGSASCRCRSCPSSPRPSRASSSERYPVRWFLTAGLGLIGLGLVEMHGVTPSDDWTTLLPGFILAGIGIGFVNPPLATAAIGVVEPRRSGAASGINSTARQVGHGGGHRRPRRDPPVEAQPRPGRREPRRARRGERLHRRAQRPLPRRRRRRVRGRGLRGRPDPAPATSSAPPPERGC